jgi:hypothetical protein
MDTTSIADPPNGPAALSTLLHLDDLGRALQGPAAERGGARMLVDAARRLLGQLRPGEDVEASALGAAGQQLVTAGVALDARDLAGLHRAVAGFREAVVRMRARYQSPRENNLSLLEVLIRRIGLAGWPDTEAVAAAALQQARTLSLELLADPVLARTGLGSWVARRLDALARALLLGDAKAFGRAISAAQDAVTGLQRNLAALMAGDCGRGAGALLPGRR